MQTASFTGFFKTLLYIFAFYYIFKFVAKLVFPILMRKTVEKAQQNFEKQFGQFGSEFQQQQNSSNKETSTNYSNPKETKKVGEYIDFEEIE